MSDPAPAACRRLHIGNISPALKEKAAVLSSRLARFGRIVRPLELHSKPAGDHYFGYVDMQLGDRDFARLQAALHGMLYMGRKISIAPARPAYDQAWKKDHGRPAGSAQPLLKTSAAIAAARAARIREAATPAPRNRVSGAPLVTTSVIGANHSSMGYQKSAHTFQDASGNTKHKPPAHALAGPRSYGCTLQPRAGFRQQYSRTSGHGDVVPGRVRKTARPPAHFVRRQQTMRVLVNGELKQIRCYKTKLWGVELRPVRALTHGFVDGAWRSGDGHVVERSAGRAPEPGCGISGAQASGYGGSAAAAPAPEEASEPAADERSKNNAVLARLFSSLDSRRQAPLEPDEASDDEAVCYDSKGRRTVRRFDFEAEGVLALSGSDDDAAAPEPAALAQYKASHERPPEDVYYSESDEGNVLDMDDLQRSCTTEAIKTQYDEEHAGGEGASSSGSAPGSASDSPADSSSDSSSDLSSDTASNSSSNPAPGSAEDAGASQDPDPVESDEDLMPKFTAPEAPSTTETLRSLFNQSEQDAAGFSLAAPEDDIDNEKQAAEEAERQRLLEQIRSKQDEEKARSDSRHTNKRKFGLFWSHAESPFLQTQTQLGKIGSLGQRLRLPGEPDDDASMRELAEGEEDDYEKWFWSVRGEVGRECKKKRREATKNMRKRNVRAYV